MVVNRLFNDDSVTSEIDGELFHLSMDLQQVYGEKQLCSIISNQLTTKFLEHHQPVCGHAFELIQVINSCINAIHQRHTKKGDGARRTTSLYFIYDLSDQFISDFPTLFQILFKLPSIVSTSSIFLSNIWLSRASWTKYVGLALIPEPIFLHFPSYSKMELGYLLDPQTTPFKPAINSEGDVSSSSTNSQTNVLFSGQFTKFFLDVFFPITNCLPELLKLHTLLFRVYESFATDLRYQYSQPTEIIKAMQLYFKQTSLNISQALCAFSPFDFFMEMGESHLLHKPSSSTLILHKQSSPYPPLFKLPEGIKYILIASYLASHNPSKFDSRIFGDVNFTATSRSRIISGSRKRPVVAQKPSDQGHLVSNISPYHDAKPFVYERMLAIYTNIVESIMNSSSPNVCVQSQVGICIDFLSILQVTLLVQLGLLERCHLMEKLDEIKLRCLANYDLIEKIAKSIKFDLKMYLIH